MLYESGSTSIMPSEYTVDTWHVYIRVCGVSCENKKDGYRQLNVRPLGSLRPWDHRSKCYMDRINACQTPRSMYPSIFNHL